LIEEGAIMNCSKILELLPLYIENELDDSVLESVRIHLTECSSCQQTLSEFHETDSFLKSASLPPVPSSFSLKWEVRLKGNNNHYIKFGIATVATIIFVLISLSIYPFFKTGKKRNEKLNIQNTRVAIMNTPTVIKLKINSNEKQNMDFIIKLKGG